MYLFVIILIVVVFLISIIRDIYIKHKYYSGNMPEEESRKYEQIKENQRKAKTISKVMIVGSTSNSRKKVGSSVVRGAVGGTLLGPVGLVGGALSGKNKVTNETTFLIEYEDGHRETKKVDNNSYEFQKLCKYLEM